MTLEYSEALKRRLDMAHEYARDHLQKEIHRQRRQYYHEKKLFEPGNKVWLFSPAASSKENSWELVQFWTGPWLVVEKKADVLYRITPHADMKALLPDQTVSIDRLKPYREPAEHQRQLPPSRLNPLDDDEFAELVPAQPEVPGPVPVAGGGPPPPPAPAPPPPPRGDDEPEDEDPDRRGDDHGGAEGPAEVELEPPAIEEADAEPPPMGGKAEGAAAAEQKK